MWIYKCKSCETLFCHDCSGSNNGHRCPDCKSDDKRQYAECHGR